MGLFAIFRKCTSFAKITHVYIQRRIWECFESRNEKACLTICTTAGAFRNNPLGPRLLIFIPAWEFPNLHHATSFTMKAAIQAMMHCHTTTLMEYLEPSSLRMDAMAATQGV